MVNVGGGGGGVVGFHLMLGQWGFHYLWFYSICFL